MEKKLVRMEVYPGEFIGDVVHKLVNLRKFGKTNYYAIFNDRVLYSKDVTIANAYQKLYNPKRKKKLVK